MKSYPLRLLRLVVGLTTCALGIVFVVQANIGVSPWDVFHQGLSGTVGISFGNASITVGLCILAVGISMGEKLGFGTLLNILYIGKSVDFLFWLNVIPKNVNQSFVMGVPMLFISLCLTATGTFLYISSGFGSGPRDSMMVAFSKRLPNVPVGAIRAAIEICACAVGWVLGGQVGIGTVVCMICIGPILQFVFRIFKFNVADVKHESLVETFRNIFGGGKKPEASAEPAETLAAELTAGPEATVETAGNGDSVAVSSEETGNS